MSTSRRTPVHFGSAATTAHRLSRSNRSTRVRSDLRVWVWTDEVGSCSRNVTLRSFACVEDEYPSPLDAKAEPAHNCNALRAQALFSGWSYRSSPPLQAIFLIGPDLTNSRGGKRGQL